MSRAKIVVVGSTNMDFFTYTDHIPALGETVIGNRYLMVMGGKGANQAVGAARLGAESNLVGRVGNDLFGQNMLNTLVKHGVSCEYVKIDHQEGSGVALVIVQKEGDNIIVVVPGANMHIDPGDVSEASDLIKDADVLMLQLEIPVDVVEKAIDIALDSETICILNPAPARNLPNTILQKVHLLTPNQSEARTLTGMETDSLRGAQAAGEALLNKGVETVVITLGSQGALIVGPENTKHMPGISVNAIDTTGAGDAFMAGLGVALAEGKAIDEAVSFANIVGALTTTKHGAMPALPTRDVVEMLFNARSTGF